MRAVPRASSGMRASGIVLIVLTGLLNFHVPHFLLESSTRFDAAAYLLAFVVSANLALAIAAGAGIWRDARWAWLLGVVVVALAFSLYIAQETVGLPGLPKAWLEPSRLVSLAIELAFVWLACSRLLVRSVTGAPV